MVNFRKFAISGGLFSGFETMINLDLVDSNDDIISYVVTQIHKGIEFLPELCIKLTEEREKYHIHDVEFGNILISEPTAVFYVCNHCTLEKQESEEQVQEVQNST